MATTTITFGILAGGGFVTAAAIAGALGLGLVAVALKSRRRRYHGGGNGGGNGGYQDNRHNYGHSGGGGGGYHRRRSGRNKREVRSDAAKDNEDMNEIEAMEDWKEAKEKEERMMQVVRAEDSSGCGLKLVCQLASMNNESLTYDHLAILDLVGPGLLPYWYPSHPGNYLAEPQTEYRIARGLGQIGLNCGSLYPTCPVEDLVVAVDSMLP